MTTFTRHKTVWHIHHDGQTFRSWNALFVHLLRKHGDCRAADVEYSEVRRKYEAMRNEKP